MPRTCKHTIFINMADETAFYGTWKIVECVSLAGTVEPTGIEGTEFHLDESGDVAWKVPEDAEQMPFFSCETYEVSLVDPIALKFFGSFAGHVIEFRAELSEDLMLLTYESCCLLQCQKISATDPRDEVPFSFLGALSEGYFSDLVIKAETGKEYHVHQTVLGLTVSEIDWSVPQPCLSGLPEVVIETILHYVYAECLPKGLSEETAQSCVKAVGSTPGFEKFTKLCQTFLKNTALRQQITSLVTDMHACADKIIDLFNGKTSADGQAVSEESLMTNPAKLCYVVKQGLREAAVAGAKLVILCELFSRRKGELSREERHEIIKYAKSRLPIFMSQLRRFLEVCRQHSSSLTASQRHEIATYLVPEIEVAFDTISTFVVETKTALEHVEQVISSSNTAEKFESQHRSDKHKKGHMGDVLGKSLRNALHMRELMKLRNFHEKTTHSFMNLMSKKEYFSVLSQEEKIRSVAKHLEQMIDEVPYFLFRIEELMCALDEKVTWREWKYLFKLGTSKVAWVLSKVQMHQSTLQTLITQACQMVHRDQFNQCLMTLNLMESPQNTADGAFSASPKPVFSTKYAQLSSVESLCKPPYARDSWLATQSLDLLHKGNQTDMVFEIISVQESGDVVIDHTHTGAPVTRTDHQKEIDIHKVPAHCVIIATRCDWFRRALLSGMRESIDKKITVHDTNPELFKLFLAYLYSGQLDTNDVGTEQLADMMALADRYEMDCLKSVCEHALKHLLDEDSALFLLSLADQFNARTLRGAALGFVKDHHTILDSDVFEDLPEHLQAEVADAVAIAWHGLEPHGRGSLGHHHFETPSSVSSVSEVDELMTALDLVDRTDASTSSSSEELHYMEDERQMELCIQGLRDIVGADVPREELVRVSLAADYDINRALNFFFSS